MVFKLLEAAQKTWRRLDGHNQLPKLVLGVTFNNGIEVIAKPADRQPITRRRLSRLWPSQNLAIAQRSPSSLTTEYSLFSFRKRLANIRYFLVLKLLHSE